MKPFPAPTVSLMLLAGAVLADAPAAAQEADAPAANPNVILDSTALDDLPYGGEENTLLPAPDRRPISRLLISPSGRIVGTADLSAYSESTVTAAPTTPIQSSELGAPGEDPPDEAAASASAVETAAGDPPETAEDDGTMVEGQIRIPFAEGSDVIPETSKGRIVGLIEKMNGDYGLRLQVLAYAEGDEDEVGHARGVSLQRALTMRDFLAANGLDLSRVDVRALGNTAQEDPADRVDLIPLAQ
jgi:outer membrane protein OmpA-like peptidoglycan-associated protein